MLFVLLPHCTLRNPSSSSPAMEDDLSGLSLMLGMKDKEIWTSCAPIQLLLARAVVF